MAMSTNQIVRSVLKSYCFLSIIISAVLTSRYAVLCGHGKVAILLTKQDQCSLPRVCVLNISQLIWIGGSNLFFFLARVSSFNPFEPIMFLFVGRLVYWILLNRVRESFVDINWHG